MASRYKLLLIVPVLLLLFSVGFLAYNYTTTGDWFLRAIELKGGTLINLNVDEFPDINALETALSARFGKVQIRESRSFAGNALSIELSSEADSQEVLQELESLGIDTSQHSLGSIGPALGETFFAQAQMAVIVAFIIMGIIVFAIFRKLIPSFAVMLAAASDIITTLALMQIFSIELSLAALAALLMLIGYSVDTDIMLTTRLLRGTHALTRRVKGALKTGLTMSITSIGALTALYLASISPVLSQIAAVLLIGLIVDLVNTWLQNSVLLRWHLERRGAE